MNIQEATKKSIQKGLSMKRKDSPIRVLATDDPDCLCMALKPTKPGHPQSAIGGWQPTLSDLIADDWEV